MTINYSITFDYSPEDTRIKAILTIASKEEAYRLEFFKYFDKVRVGHAKIKNDKHGTTTVWSPQKRKTTKVNKDLEKLLTWGEEKCVKKFKYIPHNLPDEYHPIIEEFSYFSN